MASESFEVDFKSANEIHHGDCVLLREKPCKVIEAKWSKTGKHGSGKIHFLGQDILTGKNVENIVSSTAMVQIPKLKRDEIQVSDLDRDGYLSLFNKDDGTPNPGVFVSDNDDRKKIAKALDEGYPVFAHLVSVMDKIVYRGFKVDRSDND